MREARRAGMQLARTAVVTSTDTPAARSWRLVGFNVESRAARGPAPKMAAELQQPDQLPPSTGSSTQPSRLSDVDPCTFPGPAQEPEIICEDGAVTAQNHAEIHPHGSGRELAFDGSSRPCRRSG